MHSRRDFFRQFIGQLGVLRDEIRGVQHIPLNRLHELPEKMIEQIEPVFFPEENWHLDNNLFIIPESRFNKYLCVELNETELKAFEYFQQGKSLQQTALLIRNEADLPYHNIYSTVTSLFFRLASWRICHPRESFNMDEIGLSDK
jgi:hypothetical protein